MPVNLRLRWYRAVTTIASSIGNAVAAGLSAAVGSGAGSAPTITSPSFLVAGTVDTLYPTTTFTATGSTPITWTSTALPAGMTFTTVNNQGVLAGTPTATSSASITFTATNALGSDGRALTLTVNANGTGYEPAWLEQVTGADSTYDPPLETTGTILYVATTGNDTTGNGSIGNPYLTIGKANSMLTAGVGGTIYVRGGTYSMAAATVYLKGGTSSSWTRVRRYPGESVILDGGFAQTAPFESVDRIGYLEIHGFRTRYFNAWGVFVDRNGGSNFLIRNCTATESPAALKFAGNGSAVSPDATATDITIQNIAWEMTPARVTASVASNVMTVTAIESGVIFVGANVFVPGVSSAIGQISGKLTGPAGSTGTYSITGVANYSSTAMICSRGLTSIDFGTGVCSNISVDLVKIQRINPIATNDTAADGIAIETGGNITIDRAYVKDVDGDCIDVKNDLGNYTLKRSVGIQANSGRNIFKAWPGAGYTSTFDNCLGYRSATYNTSPELVAFAGTVGSHTMRRCTIINNGINGQIVSARWAPGTTKTIQGCIMAIPNASNGSVMIDVNSSPPGGAVGGSTIIDFKYNLYYGPGRPDAYIRNNVAYGTPTSAVSQADISSGAFDTTYAGAGMVGNAVGQPTYENAAALNFRLAAGDTAALNKYLTNNGILTDADGLTGTVGVYQDIGAFERQ